VLLFIRQIAFSALTVLVGWQEEHRVHKKTSDEVHATATLSSLAPINPEWFYLSGTDLPK